MANENLESSFNTLKETVPLLIKHKISAIPTNYALWYTYVANESPELNETLDSVLESNQVLSPARTTALYRQHVSDKQEVNPWQLRQSVEAMLIELSQSMTDTHSNTQDFKQAIDSRLDDLVKVEQEGWSLEEVLGLVRTMVKDTQDIRKSTLAFNASLASAQEEIAQLRAQLEETKKDALIDALTGLNNRRFFDEELQANLNHPKYSLILIDIDHFKQVNDTHGHLMGDFVLKAVARKLLTCCRQGAQAFRYGGEEFAILLPNADLPIARKIAETMRKAIEKMSVKDRRSGLSLDNITASFGVAKLEDKMKADELKQKADKLLYEAKRLGRNRVMPMH